jgi:hypothetical protein
MVAHATINNMEWLSIIMVVSYAFQFRVFSEFFKVKMSDIVFEDESGHPTMQGPSGRQTCTIWLNGRKNRPERHPLKRTRTCGRHDRSGPGAMTCAVHRLYYFLMSDPLYSLYCQGQIPDNTLLSELPLSLVNRSLKLVAEKVGDVHFARAASHGFRRGAACDMARLGRPLSEIIIGGDWRSSAFRTYLESV